VAYVPLLNDRELGAVLMLELFLSQTVRLSTAPFDRVWNGNTYRGFGTLGNASGVKSADGTLENVSFSLSGGNPDYISLALQEHIRGRRCTFGLAVCDPNTWAIAQVVPLFVGVLDNMPIVEDSGKSTVTVNALHRGKLFQRPKPIRYTNADQTRLFPGDRALQYVNKQSSAELVWPAAGFFKVK
jgi:hypothetical protein